MAIQIGDKLPSFKATRQDGTAFESASIHEKPMVIYFYPKDLTPGCTVESCNFRDNYSLLKEKGFEVIGVSADDEKRHLKFIEKHELPFTLLADTEKEVINAYGVWGLKKFMGKEYDGIHRESFVIDENGAIEHVIHKVKTKLATEQILELYS